MPKRIVVSAPAERAKAKAAAAVVALVWGAYARYIQDGVDHSPDPRTGKPLNDLLGRLDKRTRPPRLNTSREVLARVQRAGRKGGRKLLMLPQPISDAWVAPYKPKTPLPPDALTVYLAQAKQGTAGVITTGTGKHKLRFKHYAAPKTENAPSPPEVLYFAKGKEAGFPELAESDV